jgi:hypothetical protein
MYGSDLLLAEEFLAENTLDETPPPVPSPARRR